MCNTRHTSAYTLSFPLRFYLFYILKSLIFWHKVCNQSSSALRFEPQFQMRIRCFTIKSLLLELLHWGREDWSRNFLFPPPMNFLSSNQETNSGRESSPASRWRKSSKVSAELLLSITTQNFPLLFWHINHGISRQYIFNKVSRDCFILLQCW